MAILVTDDRFQNYKTRILCLDAGDPGSYTSNPLFPRRAQQGWNSLPDQGIIVRASVTNCPERAATLPFVSQLSLLAPRTGWMDAEWVIATRCRLEDRHSQ